MMRNWEIKSGACGTKVLLWELTEEICSKRIMKYVCFYMVLYLAVHNVPNFEKKPNH